MFVCFAPVLEGTPAGLLLALIGATTFLLASGIAISQSNAKRVLAYSTIANLGLIITCAGVGNPQAVWAAILLIIFHAVAKALLFIAVGSAEHSIGSGIEDMEGDQAPAQDRAGRPDRHRRHVPGSLRHAGQQVGRD